MTGGFITDNKTKQNGGAVIGYCRLGQQCAQINISGGTISNNTAEENGGAFFIQGTNSAVYSTLTISDNALIDGNIANKNGGGIYGIAYSKFFIQGGTISNNKSNMSSGIGGGVVVFNNSTVNMTGGNIVGNSGWHGYGMAVMNNSIATMNGGTIANNNGVSGAVALFNNNAGQVSQFILNGGTIRNNISTESGDSAGPIGAWNGSGTSTYTYKSGVVCGNTPKTSYETHNTCPN